MTAAAAAGTEGAGAGRRGHEQPDRSRKAGQVGELRAARREQQDGDARPWRQHENGHRCRRRYRQAGELTQLGHLPGVVHQARGAHEALASRRRSGTARPDVVLAHTAPGEPVSTATAARPSSASTGSAIGFGCLSSSTISSGAPLASRSRRPSRPTGTTSASGRRTRRAAAASTAATCASVPAGSGRDQVGARSPVARPSRSIASCARQPHLGDAENASAGRNQQHGAADREGHGPGHGGHAGRRAPPLLMTRMNHRRRLGQVLTPVTDGAQRSAPQSLGLGPSIG